MGPKHITQTLYRAMRFGFSNKHEIATRKRKGDFSRRFGNRREPINLLHGGASEKESEKLNERPCLNR